MALHLVGWRSGMPERMGPDGLDSVDVLATLSEMQLCT